MRTFDIASAKYYVIFTQARRDKNASSKNDYASDDDARMYVHTFRSSTFHAAKSEDKTIVVEPEYRIKKADEEEELLRGKPCFQFSRS